MNIELENLTYSTICDENNCTTTYTVDDEGFVDPNILTANVLGLDDNEGPDNELLGIPYDYNSFNWSETYDNPGYGVDENGTPSAKYPGPQK
ncbi:MAG: hypothetical protein ACJASR_002502 [Psychroserpens sp.]|jgi:hypothetical protein